VAACYGPLLPEDVEEDLLEAFNYLVGRRGLDREEQGAIRHHHARRARYPRDVAGRRKRSASLPTGRKLSRERAALAPRRATEGRARGTGQGRHAEASPMPRRQRRRALPQ